MLKRIKTYTILLLFLMSCLFFNSKSYCQNSKSIKKIKSSNSYRNDLIKNKKVKIHYWKNEKSLDSTSKGISVYFTTGFDEITTFKIFINKKLLKIYRCRTNYSLGYCMTDNKSIIPNVFLSYGAFREGDSMSIQTEKESFIIPLYEKMKDYNKLKISKAKGTWYISFENDASIINLE